jgi:dephospho-CoA kinase
VALREAGWRDFLDEVWLVRVTPEVARERLLARGGLSEAEADMRLEAQSRSSPAIADDADRTIENSGDLAALARQVDEAWRASNQ